MYLLLATGFEAALIIAAIGASAGGIAAAVIQPDFPEPPAPPTPEEVAGEIEGRKKKIVSSQIRQAQRLAALGPIQLEAPTLGI